MLCQPSSISQNWMFIKEHSQDVYDELDDACDKILAQIVKMIEHSEMWVIKPLNNSSRA